MRTIFLLSESKKCRYQNRTLYIKIAQITTLLILLLVVPLKRKAGVARASNLQAAREKLSIKRQRSTPALGDSDSDELERASDNEIVQS